jgi:hypothetical protein
VFIVAKDADEAAALNFSVFPAKESLVFFQVFFAPFLYIVPVYLSLSGY